MAVVLFRTFPTNWQFFKWILLCYLLQFWIDSFLAFGSQPKYSELKTQFAFSYNGKWLFHENEKKRLDSNNQRENIHGSLLLTAGTSQHLLAKFFKPVKKLDRQLPQSLNSPIYQKATAKRNNFLRHQKRKTSVQQLQPKTADQTTRKDFVFRDVIRKERLNSYAVELSSEKDKSPRWYLAIASGFVVLLVVVALCIHAPCECLWRRHRNEHFNCPIARSKGGMCGKCYVNNSATTTTLTYKENPHKVCVTMASNGSYHRPNSEEYTSQYTRNSNPHPPGKLKQAKSKVTNLFKGSQGSLNTHKEAAGYRYRPLKNTQNRNSLHSMYDPEWTSVGAFLNKNRSSSTYLGYGSTTDSEGKFVDRYCRWSRDSLDAEGAIVECALKLRPRKRQVIELQEFPLGYSKSFLNIDLESNPGLVFDPHRDQMTTKKKGRKLNRLTFSDSDLRQLSCMDKPGNYQNREDLFGVAKPRKSSLKVGNARRKTSAKVVHFFPSNFSYDAQFIQVPPEKKSEKNAWEFDKGNSTLCYQDSGKASSSFPDVETSYLSGLKCSSNFKDKEFYDQNGSQKLGNYDNTKSCSRERAVDSKVDCPSTEPNLVQPRDYASSFTNYGYRSSIEVPTEPKNLEPCNAYAPSEKTDGNNLESMSSFHTDIKENDLSYKAEPLAGLISPIRGALPQQHILTISGNLVFDRSTVPTVDRSSSKTNSIRQPQRTNSTKWKRSHHESETGAFERDEMLSGFEQWIPEKEQKTET